MHQADNDAGSKIPVVAHKRNGAPWMVTMPAEAFFEILREGIEALKTK
jgi:hypothetical protein